MFAGWGMFAAPIDWIFQYIRRPKSVITKSEYIDRARGLAQRAKEIKVCMSQHNMGTRLYSQQGNCKSR